MSWWRMTVELVEGSAFAVEDGKVTVKSNVWKPYCMRFASLSPPWKGLRTYSCLCETTVIECSHFLCKCMQTGTYSVCVCVCVFAGMLDTPPAPALVMSGPPGWPTPLLHLTPLTWCPFTFNPAHTPHRHTHTHSPGESYQIWVNVGWWWWWCGQLPGITLIPFPSLLSFSDFPVFTARSLESVSKRFLWKTVLST